MENKAIEIKEKIKLYIHQAVYVEKEKVNDDSLIFKEGLIDSMGFITLISFLEEEFGITIGDTDLVEENFESIDAISALVVRKS